MSEEPEISTSLRNRVYFAARDGLAITLFALLSENRAVASQLLNEVMEDDEGQRCTPLIIAAKNGNDKVVKTLLASFRPDLEVEGVVKFDNFVIEGASALWVAAGVGYITAVKELVKAGANVNHATKSNSTPLRAACFDGRLDIVQYLTEHQADIHIANKFNNTCLMIASYKGHLDVVSFLLEKKADPNARANCGATAMHFAVECGHLEVVKQLLAYGARFLNNKNGMSQLVSAAERTKADVVEYLIERPEMDRAQIVEALELLGASFANDKDNYSLEKAYHYLYKAMKLRHSDPNNVIGKTEFKPVPAYENWRETRTIEELEDIQHNSNAIHMESLAIRERILGTHNPEVPHPVIFRGAVFADHSRFDRSIELWLHALHLRQKNELSVTKDLLRFAQLFSQMLHVGVGLEIEHVREVLSATVLELSRGKAKIIETPPNDDLEQLLEDIESKLTTVLYLIVIITRLMKSEVSETEQITIKRIVYDLNRLQVRTRNDETLLHLCVNFQTPVDDFHTNNICKFPNADAARLLIECGAYVDAMDSSRNTPLHIIVSYQKPVSDFMTLHSIIMDLVKAGAHMDPVNCNGETPLQAASTGTEDPEPILIGCEAITKKIAETSVTQVTLGSPPKNPAPLRGNSTGRRAISTNRG